MRKKRFDVNDWNEESFYDGEYDERESFSDYRKPDRKREDSKKRKIQKARRKKRDEKRGWFDN